MGTGVMVVAESGAGKSSGIASLDPKKTFIINVANKALPFKGWKKAYVNWTKDNPSGNLYNKSSPENIEAALNYVNQKRPEIDVIVIDDFQFMSAFEYFDRANEKTYDKFTDIGASMARIARMPSILRDDLQIYFLTHAEVSQGIDGSRRVKAKTIGKLVDNALTLEGLFTIVLFGKVHKNKEGVLRYVFETVNDTENTCKAPPGMFDAPEIPNDLEIVRKAIVDYEN